MEKFRDNLDNEKLQEENSNLNIELGYEDFIPEEFQQNPIKYFENIGKNIKPGETQRDETGRVKEDPTAVKKFPMWEDSQNNQLQVIGKKVNIEKSMISRSEYPFYEYGIMKIVNSIGLPTPKPVAKAESKEGYLIVMEKVKGINWFEKNELNLKSKGYNDADIDNLKQQAEIKMGELKERFDEAGIIRKWKLSDMVFDIDFENKIIKKIIPVDWERTKIDFRKLQQYKNRQKI
ncbi:hypothetical protein D4R87_03205 [bacterium]|nr:MAG: hypothetical protein D4R87_03205 [bacterium]